MSSGSPAQKVTESLPDSLSPHQKALAADGAPDADIHGATVLGPTIATKPSDSAFLAEITKDHVNNTSVPSKDVNDPNFVLTGKIQLFNQKDLTVDFFSYHGPPPKTSPETPPDGEVPVYQMAVFDKDKAISVSSLIPQFQGTTFDSFAIENIRALYQNMLIDDKKALGLSLEADIILKEEHGQVHDVLTKFLGISKPDVHLSCALGLLQDWHQPLSLSCFQLEGSLTDDSQAPAFDSMIIHRVGVRLTGYHGERYNPDRTLAVDKLYSYTFFGELTFPKLVPLLLTFEISDYEGSVSFSLSFDGNWDKAFSIPNLTLQNLRLETTFDVKDIKSSLSFDVEALMDIGSMIVNLKGQFSLDGSFNLEATVSDFDFDHLSGLFSHFHDTDLVKPDLDIKMGSAVLCISGGSGAPSFSLRIQDLTVGDHHAAEADVQFGSGGITFAVKFTDGLHYTYGSTSVDITNASATITFIPNSKSSDGKPVQDGKTDILVNGTMNWQNHADLTVALHLYRCAETGKMEFTILGQFKNTDGVPISTIIPALSGELFREITIQDAGLAIASRADPDPGALQIPYSLKQGFQVYAVLGEVGHVNKLTKNVPRLVLVAGWESDGFAAEFDLLCTGFHLNLGKGVVVNKLDLKIRLAPKPMFCIIGGVAIPIHHQADPLEFTMTLLAELDEATLEGDLTSKGWNNPFGVSKMLTINEVGLLAKIEYLTFLEEGPTTLGFKGDFEMDGALAKAELRVSTLPSDELLKAEVDNLTLPKLVAFASSLLDVKFPTPPDVIKFEQVKVCMAPADSPLSPNIHPGFSFEADVILFGVNAKASVQIGGSGVQFTGFVSPFSLGGLEVSGSTPGSPANLDIQITKENHYGVIDGRIKFFELETAIKVNFEMHPNLTFDFYFMLQFAGLFDLTVQATKKVAVSAANGNATEGDYILRAEFEEKIKDHIGQRIDELFKERARMEAQEASAAVDALNAEKKKYDDEIAARKGKLDEALKRKQALIDQKQKEAKEALDKRKADAQEKLKALDNAQNDLRKKVTEGKAALAAEAAKATKDMEDAKQTLEAERKSIADKFTAAHFVLDKKVEALHHSFSNAENAISTAKNRVATLEGQINDINGRINTCEHAHWYDLPAKAALAGLNVEKLALEAGMNIARGALTMAEDLLKVGDYVSCQEGVKAAQGTLNFLQDESDKTIKRLEGGLTLVQEKLKTIDDKLNKVADVVAKDMNVLIEGCKKALTEAQNLVTDAENVCNGVEASLEKDLVFIECKGLEVALAAAQNTFSAGLTLAKAGVQAYNAVDQALLKMWNAILKDAERLVNITEVVISSELGKAVKGGLIFHAEIKGTFKGDDFFHFSVDYDHNAVDAFFKKIFDEVVQLMEKGFLNPAKEIIRDMEGVGSVVVKYGPNGSYTIDHV